MVLKIMANRFQISQGVHHRGGDIFVVEQSRQKSVAR